MKISSSDTIKQFNLKDSFYNLNETVEQIKKRFAETFKKLPKNNKNVENLENEISRLSNFPSIQDRIRLTIYGNKDSGKTSFINSIIGKELIPIKNHEKEENKEDKNNIKEEKKENNIPEENTKITQKIFILRNKEEETTSLCRVNLKKVTDLANDVHIWYNIYGTEEIYSSEKALKYGIIGEEEIKKYLAQPLIQNNKETVKENLVNEKLKEINTNPKEIPNTKENEKNGKKTNTKKENDKEKSIPKFNSLFPEVENEIYIIETKIKLLEEINLPNYIKNHLEFVDIPGQKYPYEITSIIDDLMNKTSIYLIFFSPDKKGEVDSKEFEENFLYLNAALSRRKIFDSKNPPPITDNYIFLINKYDKCRRSGDRITESIRKDLNKKLKVNKKNEKDKNEKDKNEKIEFGLYVYSNIGKLGTINDKTKDNKRKKSKKEIIEKEKKEKTLKESENFFKVSLLQKFIYLI